MLIDTKNLTRDILQEIKMTFKVQDSVDYILMQNFVLLARKSKQDAEIALSEFINILNNDRYVSIFSAVYSVLINEY